MLLLSAVVSFATPIVAAHSAPAIAVLPVVAYLQALLLPPLPLPLPGWDAA